MALKPDLATFFLNRSQLQLQKKLAEYILAIKSVGYNTQNIPLVDVHGAMMYPFSEFCSSFIDSGMVGLDPSKWSVAKK